MNYLHIDCPECHKVMIPNDKLGIWSCSCGATMEDRLPPRRLNNWEQYQANTSVSIFENMSQEVTLHCPAGCGLYISTDWSSCPKCGFKWGDDV